MNKESQIRPDIMNRFHLVMFNDHFHTHLAPGRYTNYITDIPFRSFFNDLIQFFIPVLDPCDSSSGFVKSLEPEWAVFGQDPTQISGKPSRLSLLQIGSTTNN